MENTLRIGGVARTKENLIKWMTKRECECPNVEAEEKRLSSREGCIRIEPQN